MNGLNKSSSGCGQADPLRSHIMGKAQRKDSKTGEVDLRDYLPLYSLRKSRVPPIWGEVAEEEAPA